MKIFIFAVVIISIAGIHPVLCADKGEEAFYVAEKAYMDKFYQASGTLFEKFIQDFPQNNRVVTAQLYIAKSLYFQEQYVKALNMLEQLKRDPKAKSIADQVDYWLGQVSFQGKNFTQALEYAQKIVDTYPDSPLRGWGYYLAAECYAQLGEYDESEKTLKLILDESQDQKLIEKAVLDLLETYYVQQNYTALVSEAERLEERLVTDEAKSQLLFYKGEGLYGRGDFALAKEVFEKGLKFSSAENLTDLYLQRLGDCLFALGNAAQAKLQYDKITSSEISSYSFVTYYRNLKQCQDVLSKSADFIAGFPYSKYVPQVYLYQADCLYETGRIQDALGIYQKILTELSDSSPRNVIDQAHYGLAWCYLKIGEFKKAIDEFKNTIQFTANSIVRISSQIQIADAYQEKEMHEAALQTYNQILKEYPNNVYSDYIQFQIGMIFLRNDRLEEAKFSFKNLEKNFPESKLIPQARYYLAASYFSEGNYPAAQDILDDFPKDFPGNNLSDRARYLYGKCEFNQGKYNDALDIFQNLIKTTVDNELKQVIWIDTAYVYINLNKYDQAKNTLGEFTQRFKRSRYLPSVLLNLGSLYERERDPVKAKKYYTEIVENYSGHSLMYEAKLALAHLSWQEGDLTGAKKYLQELINSTNTTAKQRATLSLADIYAQNGDTQEAFKLYEELIKLDGNFSKAALAKKGMLLKETNRYAEAVTTIRRALERGIKDPQLHFALGYSLEKMNAAKEALAEYFKIIYLYDELKYKVKAYFRIAKIYEDQNRLVQAREMYEKVIGLNAEEAKIAKLRIEEIDTQLGK